MLWGLLQARAGLQSLHRCLTSEDGQGRPVDGSFSHHGSGCGTWPISGLGAGVRWCPLPREVALRGRRSQVPCRDALPGTSSLSAGTRSGSSWHLPCCEASALQRDKGKCPRPAPGIALSFSLCSLGFFQHPPPQVGGTPSPAGQLSGSGRA